MQFFRVCFKYFSKLFPSFFHYVSDLFQNGFPMFFSHAHPRIPMHRSWWKAQSSFEDDFDNIELNIAVGLQKLHPQY